MAWDDRAAALLDAFGELVIYQPRNGRPRTINAVVQREPREGLPMGSRAIGPMLLVTVKNNAKTGIASHLLNLGGDTIKVAERVGGEMVEREIVNIADTHDEKSLTLELR